MHAFTRRPTAATHPSGVGPPPPAVSPHPLEPFHRALGNFAVTRHDTLWYGAGRFSLVTFPNNRRVAATKRDIQRLLVDCGRLAAVFCPLAGSGPVVSEYRLAAKDYGLSRLQEQFRRHVRKHAGRFVTRELTWNEMAAGAGAIHADVAARRRAGPGAWTDGPRWADACRTAADAAGLFAYGCLIDGALAGYVVAWREQDVCHGVLINRDSRHDAQRTGNVLLHAFSRDQITRPDTSMVNLGRGWYPPKPSLDSFKRHAGYEERETVLAVVLHPRVEALVRASWMRRVLRQVGVLAGGWLGVGRDLKVLEAAGLTEIP